MRIGREFARRRKVLGLTQEELASRVGTTQAMISRLESGRGSFNLPFLDRVARASGGPMSLLIGLDTPSLSSAEKRRRVTAVLGERPFDPWERDPAAVEAKSLLADGLTREHFQG